MVEKLVEENQALVGYVLSRMQFRGADHRDQVEADGLAGLYHAARIFDQSRGLRFSTFACMSIKFEIKRQEMFRSYVYRSRRKDGYIRRVNVPLGNRDVPEKCATMIFFDESDEHQVRRKWVLRELMSIPWRMAEAFRMRMQGRGLKDIGKMLGVSTECARQMIERVVSTLKLRARTFSA